MRILHVPHAYPPVLGGAEKHCAELSEALTSMGHQVKVLTSNARTHESYYSDPAPVKAPATQVTGGVSIQRIPIFSSQLSQWYRVLFGILPSRAAARLWQPMRKCTVRRFTKAIQAELLTTKPDVVMTMPHRMVNVECVVEVAATTPFPLVLVPMLHPGWDEGTRRWLKDAFCRANAIVANTSAEADALQKDYEVQVSKIFTGWLGVTAPQTLACKPRSGVLFLGRIVPGKSIEMLVAAMNIVWESHPEVELTIAGAKNESSNIVEANVRKIAGEKISRIKIAYNISDETKQSLLAASTCLVLPSSNESFGIVLLEAMAVATPVVSLRLPVFSSFVTNRETGLLVDPNSTSEMAEAIQAYLENQDLAGRIGTAGRQLVLHRFTWDAVARNYLAAYEHAAANHAFRLS